MKYGFFFEIIYKTLAYASLLAGIWIVIWPVLSPLVNQQIRGYKVYTRLRKLQLTANASQYRKKFFIFRHLELLLGSTWPWFSETTVFYFVLLSVVLLSVSTAIYTRFTGGFLLAVVFGGLTCVIPYLSLLLVLCWKRSETSYELIPATSILLGKYRVNSRDIYYSLVDTIREMDQYKTLQRSFIKLASAIQSHRNKEDLENAVDVFVYQIGTSWARQIGIQIMTAQWENKEIERSLSNIVKDMGKAQEIMEQQKSSNQDTIQMGYFVPLIAFPASLFFLSKVVTSGRYFYYQFKTTVGFTSFVITFLLCLAGFTVSLLLRKPKNEI
ncbi:MAG: hypothetical protein ACYC21_04635 [Eubacteriales bacterium]